MMRPVAPWRLAFVSCLIWPALFLGGAEVAAESRYSDSPRAYSASTQAFAYTYSDCMKKCRKAKPPEPCCPEICGYRACIAEQMAGITVSSRGQSGLAHSQLAQEAMAACAPHIDTIRRCGDRYKAQEAAKRKCYIGEKMVSGKKSYAIACSPSQAKALNLLKSKGYTAVYGPADYETCKKKRGQMRLAAKGQTKTDKWTMWCYRGEGAFRHCSCVNSAGYNSYGNKFSCKGYRKCFAAYSSPTLGDCNSQIDRVMREKW